MRGGSAWRVGRSRRRPSGELYVLAYVAALVTVPLFTYVTCTIEYTDSEPKVRTRGAVLGLLVCCDFTCTMYYYYYYY